VKDTPVGSRQRVPCHDLEARGAEGKFKRTGKAQWFMRQAFLDAVSDNPIVAEL